MIGKLKGIIDSVGKDFLIVDVNGVGYVVFCNITALINARIGEEIILYIQTIVREDSISLHGFKTIFEKDWFNKLITVKGVGSKMAQSILGVLEPANLSQVILLKDKNTLTQISGVGPKLAARLLTELKVDEIDLSNEGIITPYQGNGENMETNILNDTVSALTNLGYNKTIAYNICKKLLQEDKNSSIGDLIRKSLKELAK
jgi:holliday junction DNA helicase RuvA